MQQERGENDAHLVRARDAGADERRDTPPAMRELDTFALIRILMSPDSAAEFKKALAKTFDQMESMTAAMEGNDGSAILSGRNEMVVKKDQGSAGAKKQRRIAVFYGGAHMPGIEYR